MAWLISVIVILMLTLIDPLQSYRAKQANNDFNYYVNHP